jgi:hypothetical protein
MSEFLSICPKCRQQILCDTAYVGMRVACPLCLQEITMPEAPVKGRSSTPVAGSGDSVSPEPSVPAGKRTIPLSMVIAGILVLISIAGLGIWIIRSEGSNPEPASPPVASLSAPALPDSNFHQPKPTTLVAAPPVLPQIIPSAVPLVSARPNMPPGLRADSVQQTPMPMDPTMQCRALWTFDQDGGFTAIDSSGNGFNATLAGLHAIWTKDARVGGGALKLSESSYAEAAGPVVDTSRSFTVAAWVKLSAIDKINCQTVVGIDGTNVSGFFLQLNHTAGDCFTFTRLNKDQDLPPIIAKARFAPKLNTWYFLVGMYDAGAGMISLYMDGKLQESVPFTNPWRATGKTSIGRGFYYKRNVDFLSGTVDDIRFYASALTAKQIQILAAN